MAKKLQLKFKPRMHKFILGLLSTLFLLIIYIVLLRHETMENYFIIHQTKECSDVILKDNAKQKNYFPGGGGWEHVTRSGQLSLTIEELIDLWKGKEKFVSVCEQNLSQYTSPEWYLPDFCTVNPRYMSNYELDTCIHKSQMRYIVVIGDSNGNKYTLALLSLIQSVLKATCSKQKQEFGGNLASTVDSNYFLNLDPKHDDLLSKKLIKFTQSVKKITMVRRRHCRRCYDRLWKCEYHSNILNRNQSSMFYVEFLGLDLIDRNLLNVTAAPGENETTYTYLEYLMGRYLAERNPDLLLMAPPFMHMASSIRAKYLLPRITELLKLIRTSLPSTKVYWISSFREHEDLWPENIRSKTFFDKTPSEQISDMNHVLFDALRPQLTDPQTKTFLFWDMYQVHDTLGKWQCDGAHMLPVFYIKMMGQLLQIHCNS